MPSPARILLVEDDGEIRDALSDLLRRAGHDVIASPDGNDGLTQLQETHPDLVLLDLYLPGLDGWQFRVAQKRDPLLARIPVIAMSGDDTPQAAAIDARCFVPKPFDPQLLCQRVADVLDETRRERAQEALALQDRLASLGMLAAGMAHEINNPLAYVIANHEFVIAELQRLEPTVGDAALGPIAEALRESLDGAERVRHILSDLRTFSRPSADAPRSIDLTRALDPAIGMARHHIQRIGRLVDERCPVPWVRADEAHLSQVFLNLLVNAAQALDERSAATNEVRVATRTDVQGDVVIEVRDNGRGIPRADLERVFEPFFTTKPPGQGTGLGLSICHGIVHALGGRIAIESEVGRGTAVRVTLPAAPHHSVGAHSDIEGVAHATHHGAQRQTTR